MVKQSIENLTMGRTAEEELFLDGLRNKSACAGKHGVQEIAPQYRQTMQEKMSVDNVNHPPHYNNSPAKCECGRRIECIDITRHMAFNVGNAVKYLWRCELKGNTLEDLKKAAWYIADEIKEREKSR